MTNPVPAVTVHGVGKGTESQHRTRTRVTRDCYTAVLRIPVTNPNQARTRWRKAQHLWGWESVWPLPCSLKSLERRCLDFVEVSSGSEGVRR